MIKYEKQKYYTKARLKKERGWTNKMIEKLLQNVKCKSNSNFPRRGTIQLYLAKDIEEIEKTPKYVELRNKVEQRRKKRAETEKEKERELKELAKFYEQDEVSSQRTNSIKLVKNVQWQNDCLKEIRDEKNIILTSPTGSGKTKVFLEWALNKPERPIFITAPIKALSNQRYRELKSLGCTVGIETGDIKDIPEKSEFICCTQEIYTNKYINTEKSTLIIDEFHYIFENIDRTRTYIDALKNSKAQNIFICSATLGNLSKLNSYVNKVTNKNFYLYKNEQTLTKIIYKESIDKEKIKDSLVIAFSEANCLEIAEEICSIRRKITTVSEKCNTKYQQNFIKIKELLNKYHINNHNLKGYLQYGISVYYSNLLPKEKFFIEKIFEERLIDTVVGTDALALGVNFPVKNVVFAQLEKPHAGVISKNLFQQLAGRAGRKDYFDEGYVYYCRGFFINSGRYYISDLYSYLLNKENEDIYILLTPLISNVLKGKTSIDDEVKYISDFSTENVNINKIKADITRQVKYVKKYKIYKEKTKTDDIVRLQEEFDKNIANAYFDEYSYIENCYLFRCILIRKTVKQIIKDKRIDFQSLNSLLQLRKYLYHLPKKYRYKSNIQQIEGIINRIDDSVLSIEKFN